LIVAKPKDNRFQSVGTPRRFLMFNIIYYILYCLYNENKGRRVNFEGEKKRDIFKKNNNKKIFFSFLKTVYKKCRLCYYNPNRNL